MFLVLNGVAVYATDDAIYVQYIALADGSLDEAAFAAWLRDHTTHRAVGRIQKPRGRAVAR